MFGEPGDVLKSQCRLAVVIVVDAEVVGIKRPAAEHLAPGLRDGLDVGLSLRQDSSADEILLGRSGDSISV